MQEFFPLDSSKRTLECTRIFYGRFALNKTRCGCHYITLICSEVLRILRDVYVLINFHLHISRYTYLSNNIRKNIRAFISRKLRIFVPHHADTHEGYEEVGKTWETGLSH